MKSEQPDNHNNVRNARDHQKKKNSWKGGVINEDGKNEKLFKSATG